MWRRGVCLSVISLFLFFWPALDGSCPLASAADVRATAVEEQTTARSTDDDPGSGATGTSPKEGDTAASADLEGVVVTADRIETPLSTLAKSVGVVTAAERDALEQYFLPELLDGEPGVFLRRQGGPGQWSNISIRGAGTQHTQFQYNGMPLRDAADTQSTLQYFIENLFTTGNLERVEVLKGPQSTLHGSQAMGGVVNIIPEKWKQGFGWEIRSEFGDRNTFTENGRVYYGQDMFYLDFNPLLVHSDGEKNGGGNGYNYDNLGFTAGAGIRPGPGMALEFSSIVYDSDVALSRVSPSLDAAGNVITNLADPDKHREGFISQYGLAFTHEVTPVWDYSLKGSYGETERRYFWSNVKGNQSNYDGTTSYLEMQQNLHAAEWLTVIFGADYERSTYDGKEPRNPNAGDYTPVLYEEDWYMYDLFSEARFKFLDESLLLSAGGRFNDHEKFDSQFVGEASAAYIFKQFGTKVRSHFGTGYRTPSLYEIHGGYLSRGRLITIGNPDLKPEESLGYEFGIDQSFLNRKLTLGLTWFHTDFDDLIIHDGFANKYENANEAATEGIETYIDYAPFKWLKLSAAYTYADSRYKDSTTSDDVRKEYLPRNKVSGAVMVFPFDGVTGAVRVVWQDEKIVPLYDPNYNNVRWREPDVVTVDASLGYKFLDHYEVYMRVENLFDEEYTEGGYLMPGRWLYGGLKLSF